MDSSTFNALVQGLHDAQIMRYTQLTSSTIIVFEHAITLGDEVELIWRNSWNLGKILFMLNRYYSLAAVIFNTYGILSPAVNDSLYVNLLFLAPSVMWTYLLIGLVFFRWQGWTGLIGCLIAEATLQMRLYALYSLNKKVLIFMLTCWITCLSISAYIMSTALTELTARAILLPKGLICVPNNISPHFYVFWIPMLSFEFLLCVLALIRGFQTYKSDGFFSPYGRQTLVEILVRDSVIYFLVIFATYLTCLLFWITAPANFLEVPIGFALAMSCVLANRVLLNVRAVNRDLSALKIPTTEIISINDTY